MPDTPRYDEITGMADVIFHPCSTEFDEWASRNPDAYEQLSGYLRSAIHILEQHKLIDPLTP